MASSSTSSYKRIIYFVVLSICLVLLIIGLGFGRNTQANDTTSQGAPIGPSIVRIYYDDIRQIQELFALGIDVHEANNLAEKYVLASVGPSQFNKLAEAGWRVEVDIDVMNAQNVQRNDRADGTQDFYNGYRTVTEMYDLLNSVNAAYPNITEVIDYGESHCKEIGGCNVNEQLLAGFDLKAIRIANETNPDAPMAFGARPVFMLIAAVHSRELTTSEQALFFIEYMTDNYGSDPDVTWLVDYHDIYVVPVANPDGRWVVQNVSTPGSHRKNANQSNSNNCLGSFNGWADSSGQPGIDLNRNFSYAYASGGASTFLCNLTYRGTGPASENEVAALQAFISQHVPDQRPNDTTSPAPTDAMGILISLHSYSDIVLWPWGYTLLGAPNKADLKAVGDKLGTITGYTSCQPSVCLYSASGTTDDWSYGELGIASFTYEIGGFFDGFFPPHTIAETDHWGEVGPSFLYAARIASAPYELAHGPDVSNINIMPARQNDPINFTISADISDQTNGNNPIAAAEARLNSPFGWAGATPISMSPAQGIFDSANETATVTIDICAAGLSNGKQTVYVRGQDAAGNWGPTFAETFVVSGAETCSVPTSITLSSMHADSDAEVWFGRIILSILFIGLAVIIPIQSLDGLNGDSGSVHSAS